MSTFTIIVPAFNAGSTLRRTLASALAQSLPPGQVILCDDGSTDETVDVARSFGSAVDVLEQPNSGVAVARNNAAAAARGDWLVWLDADDEMSPHTLQVLADHVHRRPDVHLWALNGWFVVRGEATRTFYDTALPVEPPEVRSRILRDNFLYLPAVCRTTFTAAGGFDPSLRRLEDWDLWARCLLDGALLGYVPDPLYRYTTDGLGLSGDSAAMQAAAAVVGRKLLARPDLSAEERDLVRSDVRRREAFARRTLRVRDAVTALRTDAPDARRRCATAALSAGLPLSTRAKLAAAVLSPSAARGRLGGGSA